MPFPEIERPLTPHPSLSQEWVPSSAEGYFKEREGFPPAPELITSFSAQEMTDKKEGTNVLVLDLGSSNVKAAILSQYGILAVAKIKVADLFDKTPWGTITNPYEYTRRIACLMETVFKTANQPEIAAIGFTGIMHGLGIVNPENQDVLQAFTYTSRLASETAAQWRENDTLYQERGVPGSPMYGAEIAAFLTENGVDLEERQVCSTSEAIMYPFVEEMMTTPSTLSHLGVLDLRTQQLHPQVLKPSGLSEGNFFPVSESYQIGFLSSEACQQLGFPQDWASRIPVYNLGGDGLTIHYLIDFLSVPFGSIKIESTSAVRMGIQELIQLQNMVWCYLHGLKPSETPYIIGTATSSGTKTLKYYLRKVYKKEEQKSRERQNGWPRHYHIENWFISMDQLLIKYLYQHGFPSLEELPTTLLPFHLGERAPGHQGIRPDGFRGREVDDPLLLYLVAKEAVCFNLKQAFEQLKTLIDNTPDFLATGVLYASYVWLKMLSLILEINITLLERPAKEQTLIASGIKLLRELGIPQEQLRNLVIQGKTITPDEVLKDNPQIDRRTIEERYQFYLEEYNNT